MSILKEKKNIFHQDMELLKKISGIFYVTDMNPIPIDLEYENIFASINGYRLIKNSRVSKDISMYKDKGP